MSNHLLTEIQIVITILLGLLGKPATKKVKQVRKARNSPYTMYDSVNASALPTGGDAYLGYVSPVPTNRGVIPNFEDVAARFYPHAHIVSITTDHSYIAEFLDLENGAAGVPEMEGWWNMCKKHGVYRPGFYTFASNMNAVKREILRMKLTRNQYRLIVADWDGVAVVPAGYDGKQYKNTPSYDVSVLRKDFFPA